MYLLIYIRLTMNDRRTSLIAEAILLHLERYPGSADTLEGICLWWIDFSSLGANLFSTQLALEQLEQEHRVERIMLGGRQLWRKSRETGNYTHH